MDEILKIMRDKPEIENVLLEKALEAAKKIDAAEIARILTENIAETMTEVCWDLDFDDVTDVIKKRLVTATEDMLK